ncbi:hypothetical protein U1Q18_002640 [Sarracenia purpurea var. burkii]
MNDEVVFVPDDEGTKRRLPLWMLGVASADQVRKSEQQTKHVNEHVQQGIAPQSLRPNPESESGTKQIEKGNPLPDGEPSGLESCFLAKCEAKKQRWRLKQEDEACRNSDVHEATARKKRGSRGGKNLQARSRQKQRRAESLIVENSEKIETLSPDEDDGELTMEDLMSIAKEYTRTDEPLEQQRSSHRGQEGDRQLPAISLSGNESGRLPNAPKSSRRSPTHKEISSVHNSTGTSAGGGTIVNRSRTGDPAQDMLDLFLGPLLKKPDGEENKIELIEKEMLFSCEIVKQRQGNIASEVVPLTKKKSSLKDKVAMFLD